MRIDQPFRISVIIVCYNSEKWIGRLLQSLKIQTIFDRIEIIIVDNNSQDNTLHIIQTETSNWKNIHVILSPINLGFAGGNNLGSQSAEGKYCYFINPDTWLESDCLEQMWFSAELSQAIMVGAKIKNYNSDTDISKGIVGFDMFGDSVQFLTDTQNEQVLFASGNFNFIKRDEFFRLGMFDEKMFMYGEEMDLAWRTRISGGSVIYSPKSCVYHQGDVALNPDGNTNQTSSEKRFLANRNRLIVILKNCQHVLLLMLIPCFFLIIAEGIISLIITRKLKIFKRGCLDAIYDVWRLRSHICSERLRVKSFRKRNDFWMLRFLHFGFGRWHEVETIMKQGFPKFLY